MRKIYCITLTALITITYLTGCGDKKEVTPAASEEASVAETVSETEEETEEEPSDVSEEKTSEGKVSTLFSASGDEKGDVKEDAPSTEDAEKEYKQMLADEAGISVTDIRAFNTDDYDGDGEYEAFAVTGAEPDFDLHEKGVTEGTAWFINKNGCEKLMDSTGVGFVAEARVLETSGRKYALFDDAYVTEIVTYAYSVDGGTASEESFSGCGSIQEPDGEDDFSIIYGSYDSQFDSSIGQTIGHTWKCYYFHYDIKSDSVREYGADEITPDKAESISGIDLVSECLKPGDELENILHRSNGMIHVNYSRPDEYGGIQYLHKTWDCERDCYVDDYGYENEEECDGNYAEALCPPIADSP